MTAQAGGASPLPRRELRTQLRSLRRELPAVERRAAERAIHARLDRLHLWRPGRRVAVYLGMPGEVDLRPVFAEAWRRGARLYVPRIVHRRSGTLAFVPLTPGSALRANAFGIAEPARGSRGRLAAHHLDAVLVPLVGFDEAGHRLGMGAGFYDRALRRRLDRTQRFKRPRLIGIAYSLQQVPRLDPAPWDVALDLVVTERGIVRCNLSPASRASRP